jgi:hypothetical protein
MIGIDGDADELSDLAVICEEYLMTQDGQIHLHWRKSGSTAERRRHLAEAIIDSVGNDESR